MGKAVVNLDKRERRGAHRRKEENGAISLPSPRFSVDEQAISERTSLD